MCALKLWLDEYIENLYSYLNAKHDITLDAENMCKS